MGHQLERAGAGAGDSEHAVGRDVLWIYSGIEPLLTSHRVYVVYMPLYTCAVYVLYAIFSNRVVHVLPQETRGLAEVFSKKEGNHRRKWQRRRKIS